MKKNVASQKGVVYAYDSVTGAAKTGDSGNFTKTVSKDGASFSSGGGSFTEIANGYYTYAPTQAETNCDTFILHTTSSTASIEIEGVVIYTDADLNAKIDTIDGIVDSILVDTGTTGVALTSAGLDSVTIDGKTLPEALKLIAAVLCGQVEGAGTGTEVFKGLDAATTRVTSSVDSSGNRTAVVYG